MTPGTENRMLCDSARTREPQSETLRAEAALFEPAAFDEAIAAQWLRAYDTAWLQQDWDRLRLYLAPDVEFVSPRLEVTDTRQWAATC